jgi:hypothetical protein
MRTVMSQMESAVEKLLWQHVIGPLSECPLFKETVGSGHVEFDASTVAEARILNTVRVVAERGIAECQRRRRPQKVLHVA